MQLADILQLHNLWDLSQHFNQGYVFLIRPHTVTKNDAVLIFVPRHISACKNSAGIFVLQLPLVWTEISSQLLCCLTLFIPNLLSFPSPLSFWVSDMHCNLKCSLSTLASSAFYLHVVVRNNIFDSWVLKWKTKDKIALLTFHQYLLAHFLKPLVS
jgi:hypothetical protein